VRGSRLRKAHALIAALIHLRMGVVHGTHGGRGGLVCFLLSGRLLGEGTGDANATNRDGENCREAVEPEENSERGTSGEWRQTLPTIAPACGHWFFGERLGRHLPQTRTDNALRINCTRASASGGNKR
jgi:hypothetical protein